MDKIIEDFLEQAWASLDEEHLKSLLLVRDSYKDLEKTSPKKFKKVVDLMTLVASMEDNQKLKIPLRLWSIAWSYGYHKYPTQVIKREANLILQALALSPSTANTISHISGAYAPGKRTLN